MLRLFVDSGSSIKQDEKEKYNIEIIPLRINFDNEEYLDGINIDKDLFYHKLIDEKMFPKTSLPDLEEVKNNVEKYTSQDDEVLIITISMKISGEFNALRLIFEDNPLVTVFDSCLAVGGIRLLVEEVNKYRNALPCKEIVKKLEILIPRIHIMAIPENLNYLIRGGRLSKLEGVIGNILSIKPIIGFKNGEVKSLGKKRGLKNAMMSIAKSLTDLHCDIKHSIIASYSFCKKNLDILLTTYLDKKFFNAVNVFDDIDFAISCHWGPNAFGLIFVGDQKE